MYQHNQKVFQFNSELLNSIEIFDIFKNENIEIVACEIQKKCNFDLSILDIKECIKKYKNLQQNLLLDLLNNKLIESRFEYELEFRLEKNIENNNYYICTRNVNKNGHDKWSKHKLCSYNSVNNYVEKELTIIFNSFPNKKIRNRLVTDFIGKANLHLNKSNVKKKIFLEFIKLYHIDWTFNEKFRINRYFSFICRGC